MTRYEYSVGEDDPRYALEAELGETLAGLVGLEPLDHRELSAFRRDLPTCSRHQISTAN